MKNMKYKSLFIAALFFLLAGIVLLCFSIFGDRSSGNNWYLGSAMGCTIAANVLNMIRGVRERREKDGQEKEQ